MTNKELKKLVAIAKEKIVGMENRENLETQRSDDADFFDIAIWELKSALVAAYELGKKEAEEELADARKERRKTKMTRFEKDLLDAKNRNEIEVLSKRKAELERIEKQGKACKNGFKRQCLAQEYARLKAEYDKIDSNF